MNISSALYHGGLKTVARCTFVLIAGEAILSLPDSYHSDQASPYFGSMLYMKIARSSRYGPWNSLGSGG
jgi:hypothetical protein